MQEQEAEQLLAPEDYYAEEERLRQEREVEAAQVRGSCHHCTFLTSVPRPLGAPSACAC